MKCEYDYIPALSIKEGNITRLFFGFNAVTTTGNGEEHTKYVGHNVDLKGDVTYDSVVSAIIKEQYSDDKKDAIFANRELVRNNPAHEKADEYTAEYTAFQDWRAYAKDLATQIINA
jgi:hypothetical protein